MAKLKWYMKSVNKETSIEFHWLYILYLYMKFTIFGKKN